jgi:hypothetical protein
MVENMYITNCTLFTCNLIFFVHRGKREWVDGSGWLWMTDLNVVILS